MEDDAIECVTGSIRQRSQADRNRQTDEKHVCEQTLNQAAVLVRPYGMVSAER
jgi:hypothetical protein